jgi:chromosome segregation ATPase
MTTDDRLAKLQPHQQEFHKVLVDDFERLSVQYRNAFVTDLEHRDRARYAQLDEIRQQTDARHDALIKELDTLVAAVQGVAAALGKLDRRLSAVERGYQESRRDRADLRTQMAQHEVDIAQLRARVFEFDLPEEQRQQMIASFLELVELLPGLRKLIEGQDDGA